MFGDSYSTPHYCVDPQDSFWGLAGKQLGVEQIVNVSRPINSFDSVCQLLIGMQNQYEYIWKEDFFIIGVPPLERISIFDDHKDTQYSSTIFNSDWTEIHTTIEAHRGIVSEQGLGGDKWLTIHNDRSWNETQALRQIYLLTKWLDSNQANYLICNLGKPLDTDNWWGPGEFVLKHAIDHNKCILFENTYYSVNVGINLPPDASSPEDWHGHHEAEGNKLYYETSLKHKMTKLGIN